MPLRHRGYGAYISCDGEELDAYKTKVEKDKVTVSCYVASEAGKEFKVHWVDSKPPSHLSVEVRMDGRRMGVLSHTKQSSKTSSGGFRIALDSHCSYQFSLLATTDDDTLPSAYSEELGTIEVRLRRVRDFITVPFTPRNQAKPSPASIHERHRKGAGPSHCVSLGKTKEVKAKSTILRPILIDDKPYVVFRFFYRPKEYLEAKGIMPSSSTPRSRSVSVPSSSSSSAGQRRKRREAQPSHNEQSPVAKRQRTTFEDDIPDNDSLMDDYHAPDDLMPSEEREMTDEHDDKENVVEIHLSSKDQYAIPGSSASCTRQSREASVKREPSPDPPFREASAPVKREPTPVTEIRLSSKNNYAIPTSESNNVWVKSEPEPESLVKREPSPAALNLPVKREPTPITEIHLSSRNNYSIPRTGRSPLRAVKQEHEQIKAESSEDASLSYLPAAKNLKVKEENVDEREDEYMVEMHLSSHIGRHASGNA